MNSTRFPGKPLSLIKGVPMIVQVLRRAWEANVGPVVVACAEREIMNVVLSEGGKAILTRKEHSSGSDRILEALDTFDPNKSYDTIINLQGDLPTIEGDVVRKILDPFSDADVDIATLVVEMMGHNESQNPNIVKAVVSLGEGQKSGRALYFSRADVPSGVGPLYHHIGIYAYRRQSLEKFVSLAPGVLEQREELEQLRALENGMRIDAKVVDSIICGVDVPSDIKQAEKILVQRSKPS